MRSKSALHKLLHPPAVVLAGGMLTAAPIGSRVSPDQPSIHAALTDLGRIPDGRSLANPQTAPSGLRTFHHEHVLGTSLELKIAASTEHACAARDAVLAEIARLADIFSAYQNESEFRRWQRSSGPARVSPELFEVLALFDFWKARTGGALDPSAEFATRLWKTASDENRLPSRVELDAAAQSARKVHWELDHSGRAATHLSDTPLALNSIAKPYIVDRAAAAALASPGVSGAVVNIGGDLVVRGALIEPVHIADPLSDAENSPPVAALAVSNRAVATSGSYRRGVKIGGRHYSHIVDPRTGEPVDHVLSSSVVAPNAADAGALAAAFSVMSIEESRRLAAALPGVDFLLVGRDGGRVTSTGWSSLQTPDVRLAFRGDRAGALFASAAQAPASQWDPSFELVIGLELTRFQEIPYHRPYVAVWIEDKQRALVRTVAVWYDQEFWLHELRAWYRAYQARPAAEKPNLASISSATRPAGKYSFKWDGKDNTGKPVKAGSYTVCVEAVRQSAEYEIIRQEMDFTRVPRQIQLAGRLEVSSVSLQYRKANERQ